MRNAAPLLFTLALALGVASCATSADDGADDTPSTATKEPQLDLRQVIGPAELNYPYGAADLRFELRVANHSAEPITLRRFDLASIGGGAYSLRREMHTFNQVIPPQSVGAVTIWAKAYLRGRTPVENEPVTLRAIAHFDSPSGSFRNVFHREFAQYAGANDPD